MSRKIFALSFLFFIVFSSSYAVAETVCVRTTAKVPEVVTILNIEIVVANGITIIPLYSANIYRQISFTILADAEGIFSAKIIRTDEKGNILEVIGGPQNVPLRQIAEWQPPEIKNGFVSVVIEAKIPEGHKSPVLTYSFKERDVL